MGTLIGHVAPGMGFLLIGVWHLFRHIKRYAQRPNSYTSPSWFPAKPLRHLELYLIMLGSSLSIAMELFIGPAKGQPLDYDWTIPSDHLHNFEHASISFTFFVYAFFSLLLDLIKPKAGFELTQILAAIAFSQELFIFRIHSADHMGVEGHYHLLLQAIVFISLSSTLMGIGFPRSFALSFIRSVSILFQGIWFIVMGFVLWTPSLVFKGCFMNFEEGHLVVRCNGDEALHRAKSLVNLQFSWFLSGVSIFSVFLYLCMVKKYTEIEEYSSLETKDVEEGALDLEPQKNLEESRSFIHIGRSFNDMDLER